MHHSSQYRKDGLNKNGSTRALASVLQHWGLWILFSSSWGHFITMASNLIRRIAWHKPEGHIFMEGFSSVSTGKLENLSPTPTKTSFFTKWYFCQMMTSVSFVNLPLKAHRGLPFLFSFKAHKKWPNYSKLLKHTRTCSFSGQPACEWDFQVPTTATSLVTPLLLFSCW